eukprot:Em0523g6a
MPVTIKVGDKVEGKSKKLTGKKGIITKITKESHARKFTIDWDTGGTSIESARGISKTGWREERPGSDSDTDDDSTSEAEEEREDSVQREDRYQLQDVEEGYWNAHGREWVEIDHLSVDPAVNAYTGITELIWGNTLEGVEKRMEYYFYLMFPMDSIPSILEYTNINLLTKKKAPLTKGEIIKWLGIRLAMAVEPRRGPLPTYWKSESDVGVVSTAANYEGRFGMKLSRFTDISSCLQLAQEPNPQPVKAYFVRDMYQKMTKKVAKYIQIGLTNNKTRQTDQYAQLPAHRRQRYGEDLEENRAAKRQRYGEDLEENRAAKRQRYGEDLEENRAVKRQRYQESVEENRAAKRRIYRGNSATIKAARMSRYWKGRRTTTTTTTQSYSLFEPNSRTLAEYGVSLEKAILREWTHGHRQQKCRHRLQQRWTHGHRQQKCRRRLQQRWTHGHRQQKPRHRLQQCWTLRHRQQQRWTHRLQRYPH